MNNNTATKATTSQKRFNLLVEGRVQRVGYRAYCKRYATDFGLAGYAENLADGRVEVVVEGEQAAIEHFLVFAKRGPSHARVEVVEESWSEVGGLSGFHSY